MYTNTKFRIARFFLSAVTLLLPCSQSMAASSSKNRGQRVALRIEEQLGAYMEAVMSEEEEAGSIVVAPLAEDSTLPAGVKAVSVRSKKRVGIGHRRSQRSSLITLGGLNAFQDDLDPQERGEMTPKEIIKLIVSYTDYDGGLETFVLDAPKFGLFIDLLFYKENNIRVDYLHREQNSVEEVRFLRKKAFEKKFYGMQRMVHGLPRNEVISDDWFEKLKETGEFEIIRKDVHRFQSLIGIPLIREDEDRFFKGTYKSDTATLESLSIIQLLREISPSVGDVGSWYDSPFLNDKVDMFLQEQVDGLFAALSYKDHLKTEQGKIYACLAEFDSFHLVKEVFERIVYDIMDNMPTTRSNIERAIEDVFKNYKKSDQLLFDDEAMVFSLNFYPIYKRGLTAKMVRQSLTNKNLDVSPEYVLSILAAFKKVFKKSQEQKIDNVNIKNITPVLNPEHIKVITNVELGFSIYNLLELLHKGFLGDEEARQHASVFLDLITIRMKEYIGDEAGMDSLSSMRVKAFQNKVIGYLVKGMFEKKKILKDIDEIYDELKAKQRCSCLSASQHRKWSQSYRSSALYTWLCCLLEGKCCKLCYSSDKKVVCEWHSVLKKSSIYKSKSCIGKFCSAMKCCCVQDCMYEAMCKNPCCIQKCLEACASRSLPESCMGGCVDDFKKTDICSMLCFSRCVVRCCDDSCAVICHPLFQYCSAVDCEMCFRMSFYQMAWCCRNWSFLKPLCKLFRNRCCKYVGSKIGSGIQCIFPHCKECDLCECCVCSAEMCCPGRCKRDGWRIPFECYGVDGSNLCDCCLCDVIGPPNYMVVLEDKMMHRWKLTGGVIQDYHRKYEDKVVMLTTKEYHEELAKGRFDKKDNSNDETDFVMINDSSRCVIL